MGVLITIVVRSKKRRIILSYDCLTVYEEIDIPPNVEFKPLVKKRKVQ